MLLAYASHRVRSFSNPTSSLECAGHMAILKFNPTSRIFSDPGSTFPTPRPAVPPSGSTLPQFSDVPASLSPFGLALSLSPFGSALADCAAYLRAARGFERALTRRGLTTRARLRTVAMSSQRGVQLVGGLEKLSRGRKKFLASGWTLKLAYASHIQDLTSGWKSFGPYAKHMSRALSEITKKFTVGYQSLDWAYAQHQLSIKKHRMR